MNIKNLTLIYCSKPHQKELIDAFFSDCGVSTAGIAYCSETDIQGIGKRINEVKKQNRAQVDFSEWRLIYLLENETSVGNLPAVIKAFSEAAGTTIHLMHIIWKIDAYEMKKMADVWPEIQDVFLQTDRGAGRIKLSLISQCVNEGPILVGMHTQVAAKLTVMSACGLFDARPYSGVYAYETSRLNISQNDIKDIIESFVVRNACRLAERQYRENTEEEKAYRRSLWQELFGGWSKGAVNQLRLSDIDLNNVIQDLMPASVDFCVYAPGDYDSIHRAIEFFDKHNREKLIERVSTNMLAAWKKHYAKAIKDSPGMVNKDTCHFLRDLSEETIEEFAPNAAERMDEPRPGLFENKAAFYMNKLQQAAAQQLKTYYPEIKRAFMKLLQQELVRAVRQMEQEVQENIRRIRMDLGKRILTQEEIGTFSEMFVEPIRKEVNRQLVREAITGSWVDMIEDWKSLIFAAIPNQDMISKLAGMDDFENFEASEYMQRSGVLLNIGAGNVNMKPSGSYALISREIGDRTKVEKIAYACGIRDLAGSSRYEVSDINDVICLYEYRLATNVVYANEAEAEDDAKKAVNETDRILTDLKCYHEGVVEPRPDDDTDENDHDQMTAEVMPETEIQKAGNRIEVIDSGWENAWIFRSPVWEKAEKLPAPLVVPVKLIGMEADGVTKRESHRDVQVGGGASTFITVPKAGFDTNESKGDYCGLCTVVFHWNQDRWREEVKVQGSKIASTCCCKAQKSLTIGDGGTLTPYKMQFRGKKGEAIPILDNAVTLAAFYGEYLYYMETGADRFYVDPDRREQFELRSANDPELYLVDLIFA